jgi:hypothetical protein
MMNAIAHIWTNFACNICFIARINTNTAFLGRPSERLAYWDKSSRRLLSEHSTNRTESFDTDVFCRLNFIQAPYDHVSTDSADDPLSFPNNAGKSLPFPIETYNKNSSSVNHGQTRKGGEYEGIKSPMSGQGHSRRCAEAVSLETASCCRFHTHFQRSNAQPPLAIRRVPLDARNYELPP